MNRHFVVATRQFNVTFEKLKIMRHIVAMGLAVWLLMPAARAVEFTERQSMAITKIVGQILDMHHFRKQRLDDDVSKLHFDFLINQLDYYHMFFLQGDVDEFKRRYELKLDDHVRDGEIEPVNEIFNRFLIRLREATNRVDTLIKEDFDFTSNERFQADRHKLDWPKNQAEADKLWQLRIKYETLNGVLGGDPKEKVKERIWKRYARLARDYHKYDSSEVLRVYLASLGRAYDPHSIYQNPQDAENFHIHNVAMQLTGIGAVLMEEDGYTKIIRLSPGGPAARSGAVHADDRIVAVAQDDKEPVDVIDMKLNDVVELIRGPKDTIVRLTIIPAKATDNSERREVALTRDVIRLEEALAKAYLIEFPDRKKAKKYGVVDLPQFYDKCTDDVEQLIDRLVENGAEGVVLDLRRNGGGLLDQAVKLAGLFIDKGDVVQVKTFRGDIHQLKDKDKRVAYDGPLIVMVGKHSASASEIVAAALQDYGRAVIVGDKHTHGKGTVQTLLPLANNIPSRFVEDPGHLKFTIQKFYRVAGHSTQKDGVTPDIILPSVLNVLESGEAYLPNVMESDSIAAVDVGKLNRVTPYLSRLRVASSRRVQADRDFKYIGEDISKVEEQLKDKSVSLNEAVRRADKKETKEKLEARRKERRSRPDFGATIKMYRWNKHEGDAKIQLITKMGPDPYAADPDEKKAHKDYGKGEKKFEKKTEGKPDSDEKKEEKLKKDKKGKPAVDDSPKVPHLLKDPHMRETIQILVDYVRMAKETWLADKK